MKLIVIVTTIAAQASQMLLGILKMVDISAATITESVLIESPVRWVNAEIIFKLALLLMLL